jgi:predicted amidohydrolase YtcJ
LSIAQGLAIRDGKIIAVGTDRDILRLAGAGTQRIDLQGRTMTLLHGGVVFDSKHP